MEVNPRSKSFDDAMFRLQALDRKFTARLNRIRSEIRAHYGGLHRSSLGNFFDDAHEKWLNWNSAISIGARSACVEAAFLASFPLVVVDVLTLLGGMELKDIWKISKVILEGIAEALALVLSMAAAGAAGGAVLGAFGFIPGIGVGAVSGFVLGAEAGIAILTVLGAIGVMQYFAQTLPSILLHYQKGLNLAWGKWDIAGYSDIRGGAREFASGHALLFVGLLSAVLMVAGGKKVVGARSELSARLGKTPKMAALLLWMEKNAGKLDNLEKKLKDKLDELIVRGKSRGGSHEPERRVLTEAERPKRGGAQLKQAHDSEAPAKLTHTVSEKNGTTKKQSETNGEFAGARGVYSTREYDPALAGRPLRELSADNIKFTERGISVVENHTARFGVDSANNYMIDRLRQISNGEIEATVVDRNFYSHELREYVRYRQVGWDAGQPADPTAAYRLWNNAHTATLEEYRILGPNTDSQLYHPNAIKLMGGN